MKLQSMIDARIKSEFPNFKFENWQFENLHLNNSQAVNEQFTKLQL